MGRPATNFVRLLRKAYRPACMLGPIGSHIQHMNLNPILGSLEVSSFWGTSPNL
jgi:hypothetical protein